MSQDRVRTGKQSGLATKDMPLMTGGIGCLVAESQVTELLVQVGESISGGFLFSLESQC